MEKEVVTTADAVRRLRKALAKVFFEIAISIDEDANKPVSKKDAARYFDGFVEKIRRDLGLKEVHCLMGGVQNLKKKFIESTQQKED